MRGRTINSRGTFLTTTYPVGREERVAQLAQCFLFALETSCLRVWSARCAVKGFNCAGRICNVFALLLLQHRMAIIVTLCVDSRKGRAVQFVGSFLLRKVFQNKRDARESTGEGILLNY